MPTLFQRGNGVYYIVYTAEGKRKWKSTGAKQKSPAIEALLNFEKLLSQPTDRILLSDFIKEFLSSATYSQAVFSKGCK